jgi:pilus assembly protein Flp/PilA
MMVTPAMPHLAFPPMPRRLRGPRIGCRGVTALEYGLLAGLIAVAFIGVLTTFGQDVEALFTNVSDTVTAVAPTTSGVQPRSERD